MRTKDGYLLCPICQRQKVLRLLPDTSGQKIAVWCKTCKQESIVNIDPKSLSHSA
ncbi:MAG: hypothetical protein E7434_01665 [Ruminococcaceae bacterium]|nr:hypothetical protein [Oscillospiraceae bacterium]